MTTQVKKAPIRKNFASIAIFGGGFTVQFHKSIPKYQIPVPIPLIHPSRPHAVAWIHGHLKSSKLWPVKKIVDVGVREDSHGT